MVINLTKDYKKTGDKNMKRSLFDNHDLIPEKKINEVLLMGEDLEEKGNLKAAYFLYRGLSEANPSCKACLAHKGKAELKLREQGENIELTNNKPPFP